jgi:hypothetical protein
MSHPSPKQFAAGLLAFFSLLLPAGAEDLRLTMPTNGCVTANNMPSLAWTKMDADEIQVWLDGRQIAALPGDYTRLVPFPLSFGPHHWKVVAVKGTNSTSSSEASFTVDDLPMESLPESALLLRENWRVESAEVAGTNGAALSSPSVDTSSWALTSLPATVLTALVRNGVYPNPYVGLNNMRIPDASDSYNSKNDLLKFSHLPGKNPWTAPYWYRTTFKLPETYVGKRVWLTFNEINYRAEVWLNGKRIAGPSEMVGMERKFSFDVTDAVSRSKDNCLAVAIYPLDKPGEPAPPPITPLADPGRNMGADAAISANYSKWDTIGWDWQPEVHDRDVGITEDVFLSATDDLEIKDLYAASDLDVPDLQHADIKLAFDVTNHASAARPGTVNIRVKDSSGHVVTVEMPFDGKSQHIVLTPADYPQLRIEKPEVWWPAGEGAHPLYTVDVEIRTARGQTAHAEMHFGIRKVETGIDPLTGTRYFAINGRWVFIRGGNWVIDMMLNWTAARYEDEIALARQANLNYLRVWGPTGVPPEAFFDAADRAGILIQQDFLNDNWGTEHSAPGNMPPEDLVEQATTDIIKKCRNHPCVVVWCGGNEGPNPREDLIKHRLLPRFDPWGSRFYLRGSNQDGVQGGGPYDNLAPELYFGHPKLAGFNSEIGPSGIPEWESLLQFLTLPPTNWAAGRFPLDGQWAYHDAADRPEAGESRKFSHLDTVLRNRYGAPEGTNLAAVRAYSARAQMLNYDTYRAVTESLNKGLWTRTTGFALWKYNSSWPSLVWQLDDWYLQCHAGFYATRRGCEPIHVQFNPDDRTLTVVNRSTAGATSFSLKAALYDTSIKPVWNMEQAIRVNTNNGFITIPCVPKSPGISFLKLALLDRQGAQVADNLYWLNDANDFKSLARLGGASLQAEVTLPDQHDGVVRVKLTNHGTAPALLVRLQLIDRDSHVEILPTLWSDNYVNLLPGDTVELTAQTTRSADWPVNPAVSVSGYNVPEAIY